MGEMGHTGALVSGLGTRRRVESPAVLTCAGTGRLACLHHIQHKHAAGMLLWGSGSFFPFPVVRQAHLLWSCLEVAQIQVDGISQIWALSKRQIQVLPSTPRPSVLHSPRTLPSHPASSLCPLQTPHRLSSAGVEVSPHFHAPTQLA